MSLVGQNWQATLGGIPITIVPSPPPLRTPPSEGDDPLVVGEYLPQDSTKDIAQRDVPQYLRRFSRGFGVLEKRDDGDDGGLAWAEDGFTHFGNGLMPSGARITFGPGIGLMIGGVTATGMMVTDSKVFNNDLYCITSGGCVLKFQFADPTAPPTFSPALNAFGSATTSLRAGYTCKAIEVFAIPATAGVFDAAGTPTQILVVSAYNVSTGATRLYQLTATAGWVESAVLGYGADKMAVVYWEGRDGVGANRFVIQVDDITIRHCIYGANPLLAASYVTPIQVGNPYFPITRLIAAPSHLWVGKANGWHDVNEVRTANISPYWADVASYTNALVATLYDDGLMAARGYGLDRLDTRLGDLVQQRLPGECGPSLGAQDGTPITGQITGLAQHDGALLMALWNADNLTSYVGRAYDRGRLGQPSNPNPLVHYWAEQVIKPVAGVGQQITHLTVTSPTTAGTLTTLPAHVPYLWMFTADVPTGAGFNFSLYSARLPSGSGPLSIIASAGTMQFNTPARFYFSSQIWDDRTALKVLRRVDLVAARTSATSTVELKARADGDPTTWTTGSTWTSLGTATTDITSLTPTAVPTGHSVALQAILTTGGDFTSPPLLREVSPRAAVRREVFKVDAIWIVLERLHELVGGVPDVRDPDTVFSALAALQTAGYQTYIDPMGVTSTVLVEQTARFVNAEVGDGEWRTLVRLELTRTS